MYDRGAVGLASSDHRSKVLKGQGRGDPIRDRVAEDPLEEHVLDHAAANLPLVDGRVLPDVIDPLTIRLRGNEFPLEVVIVLGSRGNLALASLQHSHGPWLVLRTQPPYALLTHVDARTPRWSASKR